MVGDAMQVYTDSKYSLVFLRALIFRSLSLSLSYCNGPITPLPLYLQKQEPPHHPGKPSDAKICLPTLALSYKHAQPPFTFMMVQQIASPPLTANTSG